MTPTLRHLAALIRDSQRINIIIHQQPDGDAVGSASALYHLLKTGRKAEIVSIHPIAAVFLQVVGTDLPIRSSVDPSTDLLILLDCPQLHRTGLEDQIQAARKRKVPVIAVDHHPMSTIGKQTDFSIIDQTASSTSEIIVATLNELRYSVTPNVAQSLLLGIFTDTGGFRHANTTEKTLRVVSRLISWGADTDELHHLFDSPRTLVKSRLWGHALSLVNINGLGIASVVIRDTEVKSLGATEADLAGLANNLSLISEARAALVLIETSEGWRGTLRTRYPHVDLRRLCYYFGGRGTRKATGFLISDQLLPQLKTMAQSLDPVAALR